jgi:hypothetical protein
MFIATPLAYKLFKGKEYDAQLEAANTKKK